MMDLQTIAKAVGGVHYGENTRIDGITTDSRQVSPGDLFVALRGERFDGHDFVDRAVNKGARAVIVEGVTEDERVPRVVVTDTLTALCELAAYWRTRFNLPIVAITGSCGKTTVKELIGNILKCKAETLVSQGSFNNAIGLPLTLLKLEKRHQFAVVEIGMNQFGEILFLTNLTKPSVAVITNAGEGHLEFLRSIKQVAIEKGSILKGLSTSGIAVLNRDDEYFEDWKSTAEPRRVISFGFSEDADVSAQYRLDDFGSDIQMNTPLGAMKARLNLLGEHNVINALAATATAIGLGVSPQKIKKGLSRMSPVKGRLQIRKHKFGGQLIDDTYNANPVSTKAAIAFLSELEGDKRLIMGDMFELGTEQVRFHQDIGKQARDAGIGRLYCLGDLSEFTAKAFGRGAKHYVNKQQLVSDLELQIDSSTTLLVKGSRGMKMDQVADHLYASQHSLNGGLSC